MSDAHEQSVSTQHITQHIAHADTADSADSADTADTADPGALSLGRFLRACSRRIGADYRRRSCQHRPATRRGCPPHTAAQSRSRNSLRAATPPRSFSQAVSQAVSHCQPSRRCCLEQVRKGRGQGGCAHSCWCSRPWASCAAAGSPGQGRSGRCTPSCHAPRLYEHSSSKPLRPRKTAVAALSDSSTEDSCSPL